MLLYISISIIRGKKVLKWLKVEDEYYISEDKRFIIEKIRDVVYGNPWQLHDINEPAYYKGLYLYHTL